MNDTILQEAGLTKAEINIYKLLIKFSPCTPPQLATKAGESRTNTYKVLDSLEEKALVTRDTTQKKLRYWANNPANLLESIKKKRREIETIEKQFKDSLPAMIDEYFKYSEQPSIRHFNGVDGVKQIYQDQLDEGKPITFTMSFGVRDFYGESDMHKIRNQFPKRGIPRKVFYPDVAHAFEPGEPTIPIDESDRRMLLTRTWVKDEELQAPVEWGVYGDKLAIISLGTEIFGMIIESPQIARSFEELLTLLDKNIRAQPDYDKLPQHLLETRVPENA